MLVDKTPHRAIINQCPYKPPPWTGYPNSNGSEPTVDLNAPDGRSILTKIIDGIIRATDEPMTNIQADDVGSTQDSTSYNA